MSISLTETAARHVASFLSKRGKGIALRLGVRTTGCSGLAYKLEYADDIRPEDHRFESHGITVVVDPKSLPERAVPIPGAKPPVYSLPYQDPGHPEEVDAFRDLVRGIRGQPIDRPHGQE